MSWVIVTGSARRIGRAIALELAEQGWDIVLHYNRSGEEAAQLADEIIELEQRAVLAEIDLANADHVARLIPSLAAEIGPIAALVNNASLFEPDTKDPDGGMHMAINATAPRLLGEALLAQMPEGEIGGIVNLLDAMPPGKNLDAYDRSKAELRAWTLRAATTFAPRLCVNGIAPGPILPNARQSEQHFEGEIQKTLLKRRIAPEEIARAVGFFLSTASVTGQILAIDGGAHLQV